MQQQQQQQHKITVPHTAAVIQQERKAQHDMIDHQTTNA
jgi:hypothetical protein